MSDSQATAGRGSTLASRAYEQLKREIITAKLLPEQKLHIGQLCERYQTGLSPIREALNRLSRDGMVLQVDRRGFRVAPISIEHLEELTRTRCWLNEIALRESIAHGDERWEENVVIAYHRLNRQARHVGGQDETTRDSEWEEAHRSFHGSLIAGCRSQWLRGFCDELFDAAERYRYLSRVNTRSRTPRDEHKEIMEAATSRNAAVAVRLLTEHLERTAVSVRARLETTVPVPEA
jgi:Transcriptional regulators